MVVVYRVLMHVLAVLQAVFVAFTALMGAFAAVRIVLALLVANVIADLVLAFLIAGGSVKGDWEFPLVFAVIPAIGIVYAVTRLRSHSV